MNVEVEILASDTGKRSTHVLSAEAPIVIGRARECHLPLEHELVSRKHAVVRVTEDLLRVEDTSRNGTLAGGLVLRNTVTEIPWGAPIGIGSYQLTFRPTTRSESMPAEFLKTPVTIVEPLEEVPTGSLGKSLAPLQPYLDDDNVTELLINGPGRIYVERAGQLELTPARFVDVEALLRLLREVAWLGGQCFDEQHPVLQARLPDGRPLHAVAPPAAAGGPYVAIGRPEGRPLDSEGLIELGSLSREASATLQALIAAKQSLIIAGPAGSGKSALLAALTRHVPRSERIGVIEQSRQLELEHPHAFYLEAGSADVRELFRAALGLRPDRLVIGEICGSEALDISEALVSGYGGCLCTLRAASPRDALRRLETLAMSGAQGLVLPALRLQIAAGANFILQASRMSDGSRKVTHLTEVLGYDATTGRYQLQDIFVRKYLGLDSFGRVQSELVSTGAVPSALEAA